MTSITYSGPVVSVDGTNIRVPYDVLDAFAHKNTVMILMNPDEFVKKTKGRKNLKNLVAYDVSGKWLWDAEFPDDSRANYYWNISSKVPLVVYSFSSNECEIDLNTGKILKVDFYK